MKENIFEPLGMDKACYHVDKDKLSLPVYLGYGRCKDAVTLSEQYSRKGHSKDAGKDNSLVFGEEYRKRRQVSLQQ